MGTVSDIDPKSLGALLGLLAHDLRNPLSALQSNVGYLSSAVDPDDVDAQEAISDALVSCEGLVAIIDNLELLGQSLGRPAAPHARALAASSREGAALASTGAGATGPGGAGGGRPASGYAGAELVPVVLKGVLQDVVNRSQALARSHGVGLELQAGAEELQLVVRSQREMLTRAMGNLVRNGIQHTSPREPVRVSVEPAGRIVCIKVSDGGPLLNADLREAAFTAIGQLTAKASQGGRYSRGLGLYSASTAAARAGGIIESAEDGGRQAFLLKLPRA